MVKMHVLIVPQFPMIIDTLNDGHIHILHLNCKLICELNYMLKICPTKQQLCTLGHESNVLLGPKWRSNSAKVLSAKQIVVLEHRLPVMK